MKECTRYSLFLRFVTTTGCQIVDLTRMCVQISNITISFFEINFESFRIVEE